jgi:hypothetical protein
MKDRAVTNGAVGARHTSCPACGGQLTQQARGVISPWVRERIATTAVTTSYSTCAACGSGAFGYRYGEEEMERLYRGYRDPRYVAQRHAWEPTYSAALNANFGEHPEVVAARQAELVNALGTALGKGADGVRTVVDIGGDRGQFIPDIVERKFVLDVSGKPPVPGVVALDSMESVRDVTPDLVMVCGLLEHLARPSAFLCSIYDELDRPEGLLVYVEVPAGVPDPRRRAAPDLAASVGALAARWRPAWAGLDALSARWRGRFGSEFPLMPLRQSEHLTFFTDAGLRLLLEEVGAEPLLVDEYPMPSTLLAGGRVGFSRVLRALVRMHSEPTAGRRSDAHG